MNIIPAIDLKDGRCVRLLKGDFDMLTRYDIDPMTVAKNYQQQGANYLHIVDLDGAKQQKPQHTELIKEICETTSLTIQVGGGLRNAEQITTLLDAGVSRVIIGSTAITQTMEVMSWLKKFGAEKIVLALDALEDDEGLPWLYTHGWQKKSDMTLWDLLDNFQTSGLKHVLCTDIARDGTLSGPNIELYQRCQQRYPLIQFQASGGVGGLADITALKNIDIAAVIIGKALYENKISLAEIFNEVMPLC